MRYNVQISLIKGNNWFFSDSSTPVLIPAIIEINAFFLCTVEPLLSVHPLKWTPF